ncbi:hypothetical protein EC844_1291 [Acinetobacter calcoaceticus]|uniref:Uncharacterized protein n=1 Tax=Acinetobacter calcoaceticus TaxID=471 RepID=A0A4V2QZK8_ACICA|nr:hypothetical protein EC844_1291 [Acinetobacter calcoaceticus]
MTADGSQLEIDDSDYVYVTFYYNRLGVNDCENYLSKK